MNVKSVEKQEKCTVELMIEVSREEFEAAIEKVYKKQRGSINVPGFRKGHAPRKIIEGMYGSGVFYEEAVSEVYPKVYAEAIEQEKLDAVAWPRIEVQEVGKDGFTFKAIVTTRPEATLGEYKNLTAEMEEIKVTEEDIDNELKPYISRATRVVTVERKAKKGDTVVLDFEGFMDGKPFDGGKAEGHSLELGSNSFVPGFEEQLVGMKAGDEGDLDITFPEDYHEELAGKAVVFKVKIHEVKEAQTPELDDEFAKDVSEFDTLAEFRKDLSEKVKTRRESQAQRNFETSLIQQVIDNMQVEIPEPMVEFEAEQMMNEMAQRLSAQGIPFEQYVAMTGGNMDMMREKAKESAKERINRDLALSAIAAAEKIEISDADIDAEYKRISEEFKVEEAEARTAIHADDLRRDLASKKAERVIYDTAKAGKAPAKKKAAPKKEEDGEEKPKKAPAKKAAPKKEETGEEKPKKAPAKKAAPKKEKTEEE